MTRGGRFAYHHTVFLITLILQMETFCKLAKIVCHTFLMMRGAGYLVQFMEDAEYTCCCVHNSIYILTRLVGQVKSEKLKTKS
jgi:hypothetical protein